MACTEENKGILPVFHIVKLIILIFIAIMSIIFCNDIFSVLLNAVLFLTTILFDISSAAWKAYHSVLTKRLKNFIIALAILIFVVFLAGTIGAFYSGVTPNFNGISKLFVGFVIIISAILSVLADFLLSVFVDENKK